MGQGRISEVSKHSRSAINFFLLAVSTAGLAQLKLEPQLLSIFRRSKLQRNPCRMLDPGSEVRNPRQEAQDELSDQAHEPNGDQEILPSESQHNQNKHKPSNPHLDAFPSSTASSFQGKSHHIPKSEVRHGTVLAETQSRGVFAVNYTEIEFCPAPTSNLFSI